MSETEHLPPGAPAPPVVFTVRGAKRIFVTWVILGLNVAMFGWTLLRGASPMSPSPGDLLAVGANQVELVVGGQWWRLLTCMFVHVGLIHLFVNMFSLRAIGPTVERLFGNFGFLWLYLLSGIGASIASCLWNPGPASAGASGALFGLIGGLVAFLLTHRREMPVTLFRGQLQNILFVIALNVMIGLSVPMVDNSAHFGGLATGFVAGLCLYREALSQPVVGSKQVVRLAALFVVLVTLAALIPWRVSHDPDLAARRWLREAMDAEERGDWKSMSDFATRAIETAPKSAQAYEIRATARYEAEDLSAARLDLDKAIDLDPDRAHARRLRGFLKFRNDENEKALEDFDRAIAIDSSNGWTFLCRGHVYFSLGRFDAALRDFQTAEGLEKDLAVEAQIYAWVCRARLGLTDKANEEIQRHLLGPRAVSGEPWIGDVAKFLTGETSEAEFLATLPKRESSEHLDLGVRATFLAAEKRAARGDMDGAAALWKRTIADQTETTTNIEDVLHAVDELARMNATSKSPR